MALEEPDKESVRSFDERVRPGPDRLVRLGLFMQRSARLVEVVESLSETEIVSWEEASDVGPGFLDVGAGSIRAADSDRFSMACSVGTTVGGFWDGGFRMRFGAWYFDRWSERARTAFCARFVKQGPEDNYYAHPVDGLVRPEHFIQVGLRSSTDSDTLEYMESLGIRSHWMPEIRERGINAVVSSDIAEALDGPEMVFLTGRH